MSDKSPTFIVIGPGRTGSTFLYEILSNHEEIQMARNIKETNFFNHNYNKDVSSYLEFFKSEKPMTVRGEISNMYIFDKSVASRICKHFPNVKIISILRNPYDRMISMYYHKIQKGELPTKLSIEEAIEKDKSLIQRNYYGSLLKPYYEEFDKEKIFVSTFDLLVKNHNEFVNGVLTFLGVDKIDIKKDLNNNINPSKKLRFNFTSSLIRSSANMLRRLNFLSILNTLKRSDMINDFLFKKIKTKLILTEKITKELQKEFIPELIKTEDLTGLDLKKWYYGPTSQK